jgi:hypothetical protein
LQSGGKGPLIGANGLKKWRSAGRVPDFVKQTKPEPPRSEIFLIAAVD